MQMRGQPAPKKLADRQHVCTCGLRTTRDHASSLEILRLGLSLQPLNGGAVMLPWAEKPTPLGGGEVTEGLLYGHRDKEKDVCRAGGWLGHRDGRGLGLPGQGVGKVR